MNAFKSEQDADAFALRAKHREWDDSDIEAVWTEAIGQLESEGMFDPPNRKVTERCVEILENRND
jgi:hypothetical protein